MDIADQRRVQAVPVPDDSTNSSTPLDTVVLIAVLVSTMALGAFPIVGTAVVANALAEDLKMSLTLFGAGVGVNTLFGAVFAPPQRGASTALSTSCLTP